MNDNNEAAPRFDVRHRRDVPVNFGKHMDGWLVFCDGEPITIPYFSKEEAEEHMAKIEIIYKRYGW